MNRRPLPSSLRLLLSLVALLAACTSRQSEGGECVFNDDCAEPLVCAGARCRAQCRTDRDCPGGSICHNGGEPGKKVCLPPSAELLCTNTTTDCPSGAQCSARPQGGACRWTCTGDSLCALRRAGATCGLPEGLCSPPLLVQERTNTLTPDAGSPTDAGAPTDAVTAADSGDVTDAGGATDVATDAGSTADAGVSTDLGPPGDTGAEADVVAVADVPSADLGSPAMDAPFDGPLVCTGELSSCGGRCVDVRTSVEHCGDCDRRCPVGASVVTASCVAGRCGVAQCGSGTADCDNDPTNGCETSLNSSAGHCGRCGNSCAALRLSHVALSSCSAGRCGVDRCETGYADCDRDPTNGCEAPTIDDPRNCGTCGTVCGTARACVSGACVDLGALAPSTTDEGDFDAARAAAGDGGVGDGGAATTAVVLRAGTHTFRSFTVPAGYTVRTDGTGVLDLRVVGDVRVDGTIDLSGGHGGAGYAGNVLHNICPESSHGGSAGGGSTGTAVNGQSVGQNQCGGGGAGGQSPGASGANVAGVRGACIQGGRFGGGAGGAPTTDEMNYSTGGAGGGGVAGGGGGAGVHRHAAWGAGAAGGSAAPYGTGGAGAQMDTGSGYGGMGGQNDLTGPLVIYSGARPVRGGPCSNEPGGGGGGGSIGVAAASDLAVRTTFFTGSGGGGGGGGTVFSQNCTNNASVSAGGGGGGGGGALRIVSLTRIEVSETGRLLARGGDGGRVTALGNAGGAGGGGSGGVIYLAAPTTRVVGELDVRGGATQQRTSFCLSTGGDGGIGRIRLSTLTDAAHCTLVTSQWSVRPAGGANSCAATTGSGTAGAVFVGTFPN